MENNKESLFLDSLHKYGRIWDFVMAGVFFLFPVLLCIIFSVVPDWNGLVNGLIATLPMYWAVGIIEVFTYFPMLGAGGSYLSFVTGNISNLKLPCALNAMQNLNVKAGTEEGEIISTISIAVSSIVTTVIILLGVLLIVPLQPILSNPSLAPMFNLNNIVPALFGGLGLVFVSKNPKIALAPCALMLILFIAIPALNSGTVGIMVPVSALFTIGVSRIMYKKGWLTKKEDN